MSTISELKKLLADADSNECFTSERASNRIRALAGAIALALVENQAVLKDVQNLPLLMRKWEKSSRDAAHDKIQAALRMDGLEKAMKR